MLKELSFSQEHSENIFPNIESFYHNDSLYDHNFYHPSKINQKRNQKDLKSFYISFTGKKEIPSHVKSFQDIMIEKDCNDSNICIENYLFHEYGFYLKSKIKVIREIEKELYYILDQVYSIEKKNIQSNLTDELLNSYINQVRKNTINLWNECDEGYTHGIKLLEKIMEDLMLKQLISQQKKITKKLEKVYSQGITQPNELYISSQDLTI